MRNNKFVLAIIISIFSVSTVAAVKRMEDIITTKLNVDNVQVDGNTISTTNSNGDLTVDLNGTGSVILNDQTASRVLVLDGSKKVTSSPVTGTTLGYVDFTSSGQTQVDAKVAKSTLTTKGDIFVATGSATVVRQGVGTDGQVLTADSSQTNGIKWASAGGGTPPTRQVFATPVGSSTYTTPAGVVWLRVRLVGGGGGAAGGETSGTPSSTAGADGGDTTFGSLTAGGGKGGATFTNNNASQGGSASGGNTVNAAGGAGAQRQDTGAAPGTLGGRAFIGGGAGNAERNGGGAMANPPNSGAGGNSPGTGSGHRLGQTGGAGGYVEHIFSSPAATYTYTVGGGGAGGNGAGGAPGGGQGASGQIIVEEFY